MSETLPAITKATPPAAVIERVHKNLVSVLTDPKLFEHYYAALELDAKSVGTDISTKEGRTRIGSFARRVGSAISAINTARLNATKEWRELTKTVNAQGEAVDKKLRALQATVRAPLAAWEEKEEARETNCRTAIEQMRAAMVVAIDATADDVRARLERIRGINDIDKEVYRDQHELATATRDQAIETLTVALARIEKAEKDAAELQQLRDQQERDRRAQEMRDQQDRDRAAEQMAEANRRQVEIDAANRATEVLLGWLRSPPAPREEASAAMRVAHHENMISRASQMLGEHQWGDRLKEATDLVHAAIDDLNTKLAEANDAKTMEDERRAEEQRQAGAEAERQRVARAQYAADNLRLARERDRDLQGKINRAAVDALIQFAELTEPEAVRVVTAIVRKQIPAITLAY